MIRSLTFFPCFLLFIAFSHAQVVTEEVDFDYYVDAANNDFINHFSGGYGMSQIETEGITGGSVITPDSSSWGNDNAIYCSRYKPNIGDTTFTSISFKYDSAFIHPNSFQRALSIFLRPQSDYNHYIIASVSGNKKIELLSYSWNNNPYPPLTLYTNHWYRYDLMVIFSTVQQIQLTASVFDLGVGGTSDPELVNSSSGSFNDEVLAVDTSIQVSITSARYGGATHLDNFHFEGREGLTDCTNIATGPAPEINLPVMSVYPMPASDLLVIAVKDLFPGEMHATLFSLQGKAMMNLKIEEEETILNIHSLDAGMYYLKALSKQYSVTLPVMVAR
ncbi:MAG: T9SS type A sorting domain-containing protein [Chitinophagales bacterium]